MTEEELKISGKNLLKQPPFERVHVQVYSASDNRTIALLKIYLKQKQIFIQKKVLVGNTSA